MLATGEISLLQVPETTLRYQRGTSSPTALARAPGRQWATGWRNTEVTATRREARVSRPALPVARGSLDAVGGSFLAWRLEHESAGSLPVCRGRPRWRLAEFRVGPRLDDDQRRPGRCLHVDHPVAAGQREQRQLRRG